MFAALSADTTALATAAHELFATRCQRIVADIAERLRICARNGTPRADVDDDAVAGAVIMVYDDPHLRWALSGRRTDLLADSDTRPVARARPRPRTIWSASPPA